MQAWTFQILTFGCKVNQYESQALAEALVEQGGQEVESQAQVVIINSCAITAQAVADVRQAIAKVRRTPDFTGKIILTGCASSLPGVGQAQSELGSFGTATTDLILIPQAQKNLLLTQIHSFLKPQPLQQALQQSDLDFKISTFKRARPVLKVQDGCTQGCAYCIVPTTRSKLSSRSQQAVLQEAQRLLQAGFRELMISGINLRQYHAEGNFWDLIKYLELNLSQWQGQARLRISSLDPAMLTSQGLDILASSKLICPHLHLSIQSGSASVLSAMRRKHYKPDVLITQLQTLTTIWPHFGLGADFLLGFPGETPIQFQETIDFISSLPFSYAHVFPFSIRPGTLAATLPTQIPKSERQARAAQVRNLIYQKQQLFLQATIKLPNLSLALDVGTSQGIDEYYNSCYFRGTASGHTLYKVIPLNVEKDKIIVA